MKRLLATAVLLAASALASAQALVAGEVKKIDKPAIYTDMSTLGIVALSQRCVHLGCRVPFCQTSQWFECPCHGSKYNRVGEVKKIDKPAGHITLKHAEIKLYDMPGMTGAYKVQDPAMLDKVQVGDHVQFQLDRVNSVYTITRIEIQK